jgi:hypothetical protein
MLMLGHGLQARIVLVYSERQGQCAFARSSRPPAGERSRSWPDPTLDHFVQGLTGASCLIRDSAWFTDQDTFQHHHSPEPPPCAQYFAIRFLRPGDGGRWAFLKWPVRETDTR